MRLRQESFASRPIKPNDRLLQKGQCSFVNSPNRVCTIQKDDISVPALPLGFESATLVTKHQSPRCVTLTVAAFVGLVWCGKVVVQLIFKSSLDSIKRSGFHLLGHQSTHTSVRETSSHCSRHPILYGSCLLNIFNQVSCLGSEIRLAVILVLGGGVDNKPKVHPTQ
jgi:hypothetical protein